MTYRMARTYSIILLHLSRIGKRRTLLNQSFRRCDDLIRLGHVGNHILRERCWKLC
jgi:hypothetical protein